VALEEEEVEGKIGKALGAALVQRVGQEIDMRDIALVRYRDLTVEYHQKPNRRARPRYRAPNPSAGVRYASLIRSSTW
jgi:hypothetical protein